MGRGNKKVEQMERTRTSGLAIASLVCGICAFFIPFLGIILGILGIVFGFVAIGQIGREPYLRGKGMAIAGLVCGIVVIAAHAILIGILASLA
jgi:hypothetical protein